MKFARRGLDGGRLGPIAALLLSTAAAHADGDPARGEQRFVDCAACHAPQPGVANVGPSLQGVFGRKAGILADFRYSPALKRSGITWTPETLDIVSPIRKKPCRTIACHMRECWTPPTAPI